MTAVRTTATARDALIALGVLRPASDVADDVTPLRLEWVRAIPLDAAAVRSALRDFDRFPERFVREFGPWTRVEWQRVERERALAARLEYERRKR